MKIFKYWIYLLLFSFMVPAVAVSDGIPFSFISFQTLNFVIFILIIRYFILKKAPHIIERQYQDYLAMNARAEDLHAQAVQRRDQINKKMFKLQKDKETFDSELNSQIKQMEKKFNLETEEQCSIILKIARHFVEQESIKLKTKLRDDLLAQMKHLCQNICLEKTQNNTSFFTGLEKL